MLPFIVCGYTYIVCTKLWHMYYLLHKLHKNENGDAASLGEGLCHTNVRVRDYTKAHLSLKNIVIKLTTKHEICTENNTSLTFYL